MSRFAVVAAAVALLCVSFSHVAEAQREVPRNTILKRPTAPKPKAVSVADSVNKAAGAATGLAAGTGSIMGAVLDSLTGTMLDGGEVSVVGLPARHAVTTASGVFRIDSVPPGRYVVQLKHPVLDSLGIQVLSDSVLITDGHVETLELAIPSASTITNTVCTAAKLRFGPSVILGRVVDAGTNGPATGAEVSVAWRETIASMTEGVHTFSRVRKATVAPDGTFRICGVPSKLSGNLQAIRGDAKTAQIPVDMEDERLSMHVLFLPPAVVASNDSTPASGAPKVRRAVIIGKVTNAGGVAVAGARVTVQGGGSGTSTGPDGKFTLTGILPGTQAVLVRSVGYAPVQTPLNVVNTKTNEMVVRLGTYKPMLSTVEVKGQADPLESVGFERRKKMGFGRYLTWDQIKDMHPVYTSDILRQMPGLLISGSGVNATVSTLRANGCVTVMVDNNPVSVDGGQSIDQVLDAQDVFSVEFYNSIDVPMELSGGQNSGCALLAIWTKGKADMTKVKNSASGTSH